MLTAEAANERLKEAFIRADEENQGVAPVFTRIAKLPPELRKVGYGLFDRDAKGDDFPRLDWMERQQKLHEALAPLGSLSNAKLRKLLAAVCGPLAKEAEATWELLKTAPYQGGYARRAFRAPKHPEATIEIRKDWLCHFAREIARVRPEMLTPQWLAIWGSYLGYNSESTVGRLLAAVVNQGGKDGREVFDILCQTVRNEHEIAGMSRMTARALLMADRPDGWELMEKTLLAAQRQEGLRQVILESVDEAHPEAFRRMLQIIRDEKLARFSAVVRAVDVWCGFEYESNQLKAVNAAIDRCSQYLGESSARTKALTSDDPEEVYAALWAIAYEDAHKAVAQAEKTARHQSAEIRFVTAYLLAQIKLPESSKVLTSMIADEDLRIAAVALDGCGYDSDADAKPMRQRFEQIEQLFERLPAKPQTLSPIVWPWTERKLDRSHAAEILVNNLGDLPPTRLLPYLSAVSRYRKVSVINLLAEQKKWDQLTRETLFELTGNTSPDVREAAMDAMSRVKLTDDEILGIENLFSRKAADLRVGALKLLLQQPDAGALASAERMLESKKSRVRLGGLELLRQMLEDNRERKACLQRAREFADSKTKLTKDEKTQLAAILETPAERITLDDALGLIDPAELSPSPKVKANNVPVITQASVELVKSLDELIHEHREEPIRFEGWDGTEIEELLGSVDWGFPAPEPDQPIPQQRKRLPLAKVWETWFKQRPKSLKDPDGFELIRAQNYLDTVCNYWWEGVTEWAANHKDRQAWISLLSGGQSPVKLKYQRLVEDVLDWLIYLHPPKGVTDFLLDTAENCFASVPQSCQEELVEIANSDDGDSHYYHIGQNRIDWRGLYGHREWQSGSARETKKQFQRRWRLLRFLDRPVPGASRRRPDLETALKAFEAGLMTLTDLTELLLGPRPTRGWGTSFNELHNLTHRNPDPEIQTFLDKLPEVVELADRVRERILEIELARGDTPTPATHAALEVTYYGTPTLGRILTVIGDKGFKVTNRYSADARLARLPALTEMVRSTYPREEDTQADFDREIAGAIKAGLDKQTVLEMMFLAPQWTNFVEGYFQWPGLSEGLYWFLAHMKYIDADAESAATAGGYEAEEPEEGEDTRQNRSAWERLIAERTSLTEEERARGAIDVDWFHRVYRDLTPKRWESLAAAARFAATPAQAKRARYLGEVLLGKASRKDLFAEVTQKKLKESVRLIGLYPLANGARKAADLAKRYKLLVDYRRYAKGLSGLTKPSAMEALEIGFRNLASTAGYQDPLRLEWAMEADSVKDLANGPVSVKKDNVAVTLALDDLGRPEVTTVKNDKPLKNVPPKIKKDKKVKELLERVGDLRRQASRVKESLEAAMCRGDEFEPEEIAHLANHAVLRVLLSRLVLVSDDRAGYPDKGGTSLRDHSGKQRAIKKRSQLRLAHPTDLLELGDWPQWQHDCFQASRVQPFKQIFRELYVVTKQERKDGTKSFRYAGQQVNPQQARALWNARNWHTQDDDVFKAFPDEGITASVSFEFGGGTPLDVEGFTFDYISFHRRDEIKPVKLAEVPQRIFSEVMRDLDLVTSVAHRGEVDPEATASTVEMREVLVKETCALLGLKNVKVKQPRAVIKGQLAEYAVHLGSGNVHLMPGGALCVVPVHAQHRGRLFLPFADDDPRTAEIISKVLLFAKDEEIQDPSILEQLRG